MIKKADWPLFHDSLNFHDDITNNYDLDIDNSVDNLTQTIISAANKSIPMTKPNHNKKCLPWWNDEISELIRKRKRLFRKFSITFRIEDYRLFLITRIQCRKLMRYLKKLSWQNYVLSINSRTPASDVFNKIRQLRGKYKSTSIIAIQKNNVITTN